MELMRLALDSLQAQQTGQQMEAEAAAIDVPAFKEFKPVAIVKAETPRLNISRAKARRRNSMQAMIDANEATGKLDVLRDELLACKGSIRKAMSDFQLFLANAASDADNFIRQERKRNDFVTKSREMWHAQAVLVRNHVRKLVKQATAKGSNVRGQPKGLDAATSSSLEALVDFDSDDEWSDSGDEELSRPPSREMRAAGVAANPRLPGGQDQAQRQARWKEATAAQGTTMAIVWRMCSPARCGTDNLMVLFCFV